MGQISCRERVNQLRCLQQSSDCLHILTKRMTPVSLQSQPEKCRHRRSPRSASGCVVTRWKRELSERLLEAAKESFKIIQKVDRQCKNASFKKQETDSRTPSSGTSQRMEPHLFSSQGGCGRADITMAAAAVGGGTIPRSLQKEGSSSVEALPGNRKKDI